MEIVENEFHFSNVQSGAFYSESHKLNLSTEANKIGLEALMQGKYDIRFKTYEHRWECGLFNNCHSAFNVTAFVINLATGETVRLRAVETAVAIQSEQTPIDFDPNKSGYYHHFDDVTEFYVGVGTKDGRDPDYWGVAKCYFTTGDIISWRWHSRA